MMVQYYCEGLAFASHAAVYHVLYPLCCLCRQGHNLPRFTQEEKALLKATTIDFFSVNFYW